MFGEKRTRTLLEPIDPARHSTIAPPRLSAQDLISRAEDITPLVPRRHRAHPSRRLVLTAATLTVAVGAGTLALTSGRSGQDTAQVASRGTDQGTVLVPVAYGPGGREAGSELRTLADGLVDTKYDEQKAGRYAYHHTTTWGDPRMASDDGRYVASYSTDTQNWETADGSGTQISRSLGLLYPDQASRDYWQPRLGPSHPSAPSRSLLPQWDRPPLPSDRARLEKMLRVTYGGSAVCKFVDMVYGRYVVPRRTRAEILRILADVPGFVWRGQVTDRAGRKGVAVTFDDREEHARDLLIFDPHTGELLATEHVTLTPVRISAYRIFLGTAWTDQPG